MTAPSGNQRPVARDVTADLLARYDQPGPRYTSYPTAVEFADRFDPDVYAGLLRQANAAADDPLSIYVHLPFCEHRCLFCGCHVIITPHKEKAAPYLALLKREIDMLAERLPDRRTFAQLHLGGGTPTYHSPQELDDLLRYLFRYFERRDGAELAVEVDPRVTTLDHVRTLADLGFNRMSMGVQDFTPEVQEAVARVQTAEETGRLIEGAREAGFTGINIDLIYGLPHQSPGTFERTVETAIRLGADRTAVYSFAFVPWIRGHQKGIEQEDLPSREEKFSLFAIARERFLEAGYEPIGMDHFARPEDELSRARREGRLRRNFQGYAVIPADDVVGLGISAIGDVRGAYVQNHKKLSTYENSITDGRMPVERGLVRTRDDEIRRDVIHDLMCNFRVDFAGVETKYSITFAEYFAEDLHRLEPHVKEGLAEVAPDHVAATPTGELFVRNLALCFDRYWREKHEGSDKPVFSRTV
jgi:oxygen-independent coproporphyrinogen-3 oxidase